MRRRIYYSAEQRTEIWDRWKRGESAHEIGRWVDKNIQITGNFRAWQRIADSGR